MLLTGLQPVFKVHGQNDGVCMRHYLISSSKIRCWNVAPLWNWWCFSFWM